MARPLARAQGSYFSLSTHLCGPSRFTSIRWASRRSASAVKKRTNNVKPEAPRVAAQASPAAPAGPQSFQLFEITPVRLKDHKFQLKVGTFIIVVAGANMAFAFADWHEVDEQGNKTYANPIWRAATSALTLVTATGIFWAFWYNGSRHVATINIHLPDMAHKTLQADPRKALLAKYADATVDLQTILPPHPFSARSAKHHVRPFPDLILEGPLSKEQKPYHPTGFNFYENGQKKRPGSHVPVTFRSTGPVDHLRSLRRVPVIKDLLPDTGSAQWYLPFCIAKDGVWDESKVEEVERALLEMRRR